MAVHGQGKLELRCDERFTHAITACGCVFKEITLVGSNQGDYFENTAACSKRTLKTTVATQLNKTSNDFFKSQFSKSNAFGVNFYLQRRRRKVTIQEYHHNKFFPIEFQYLFPMLSRV